MPAKAGIHALPNVKSPKNKSLLFCEQKSPAGREAKKTLLPAGAGPACANAPRTKSFLLLFFKKEALCYKLRVCPGSYILRLKPML
jgi:hypothetical protein